MSLAGLGKAAALPFDAVSWVAKWVDRRRDCSFDKSFGIETEAWEAGRSWSGNHTEAYCPTPARLFKRIIRKTHVDPGDFAFIDLGCGKGRTLLLASVYGFARVFGVELDERLCALARRNLDRWFAESGGAAATIIHGDARDVPMPQGNLFVFMFNPFTGPIFDEVARRLATIAREEHRAVLVAYSNDVCGDRLERTGAFRRIRLRRLQFWRRSKISFFYNETAWRLRSLTFAMADRKIREHAPHSCR